MHSGIFENAKTVSKTENAVLKQEINYLSAKLLTMVNIQSKFEEQIKQRQHLQIENKSLKSDLDKANVRFFFLKPILKNFNRKDGHMQKKRDTSLPISLKIQAV